MLEDSADVHILPLDAVNETLAEHAARQRSEAHDQDEVLINILRTELHVAMGLMEHRERWWMESMRNAESVVGMELGQVRAGEMHAAQEMNAQMTSMVEALRATQSRAEQSTLAAL